LSLLDHLDRIDVGSRWFNLDTHILVYGLAGADPQIEKREPFEMMIADTVPLGGGRAPWRNGHANGYPLGW